MNEFTKAKLEEIDQQTEQTIKEIEKSREERSPNWWEKRLMKKTLNKAVQQIKKQEPKIKAGEKNARENAVGAIMHIIETNNWEVKDSIICPNCKGHETEEHKGDTSTCQTCNTTWEWQTLTKENLMLYRSDQLIHLFTDMIEAYARKYL